MVKDMNTDDFKNLIFDFTNEKEWVYLGTIPSIIKFGADWCGPCKMIDPILDQLSEEYGEKIDIYKIDIENENALANAFNIKSIPSVLFIPMEGQPQMMVGGLPKEKFTDGIKEILKVT